MTMSEVKKPATDDRYVCEECGFEVRVIEPCTCEKGDPILSCCDKDMAYHDSRK